MQNKEEYAKILHNCRPDEENLPKRENEYEKGIKIRCKFPKSVKKRTYILSEFGPVTIDAVKEFLALRALGKPLEVCATSGHWEGQPFLVRAVEDFEITEEEEIFIDEYKSHLRLMYVK